MKTCSQCGANKPLTEFIKNKVCTDGRAGTCKECRAKYHREWKAQNRDRIAPRRRQLYKERYGHIARENEARRKAEHPFRVRCQRLRSGMKERVRMFGLPFDDKILTVNYVMEWLRRQPTCECCGVTFEMPWTSDGTSLPLVPSIDRIRPRAGYVIGNIALLCWRCNRLKCDATPQELMTIGRWLKRRLEVRDRVV